ncbi:MAG TPA: PD-(D/E)XK nuclease family protein [Beijerinckiaceae bacterium]|nr:PD-(D/E)XK nuclease family protein [Beijerinckiaceae bacterium]
MPVAGRILLPGGREVAVSGRIDRLLITPERIVIADFKTGRADADGTAHATQLALYRDLLRRMFPGRPVECLLVWTRSQRIERIDDDALDAALAAFTPP